MAQTIPLGLARAGYGAGISSSDLARPGRGFGPKWATFLEQARSDRSIITFSLTTYQFTTWIEP